MRFKRDEELELFEFKSRVVTTGVGGYKDGALPATVKLNQPPDFMSLSRPWQELEFELLKWQAGGTMTGEQLFEAWKDVTRHSRAFYDQHAWDYPHEENGVMYAGFHDYILDVNVDAKDISQRRLSTANNIIEAITVGSSTSFKALDLSKPPPLIEKIWGNHILVWWATETDRPNWFDGGRIDITGRWPQLGNTWALGVPFLNISPTGINYVFSNRVEPIGNDVLFNPYNPPMA